MARKKKFALQIDEGIEVRDMNELRAHFNLDKIIKYFQTGELQEWLADRYYDDYLEAIEEIDKNDSNLPRKLCAALGVDFAKNIVSEKLNKQNLLKSLFHLMKIILTYKQEAEINNHHAEATVTIKNKYGIHKRPSTILVQASNAFKSIIKYKANNETFDAKGILILMSKYLKFGTEVKIIADGSDASQAVEKLANLISSPDLSDMGYKMFPCSKYEKIYYRM